MEFNKGKKDCKKVKVLLQDYEKNLLNQENKKYVEDHLETCNKCKRMMKKIQNGINQKNNYKIKIIVIAILVCAFTSFSVIVKILITILLYIGILACVSLCAILVSIFTNNK